MTEGWLAEEVLIFKDAFLLGIVMVITYDILRLFRRMIPHGIVWVSVEDILYWLSAGIAIFLLLYYRNDGELRFYIVLGIAGGAALYYLLCGRFLFRFLAGNIFKCKKWLKKIYKAVTIWLVQRFRNRGDL